MKEEINSIKNLLYSGQKVNVGLAISIMQGLGLTWNSKGFEDEKELVDLRGGDVFFNTDIYLSRKFLAAIPSSIAQLQNVKWFDLSDNKISHIPESIGRLQVLETVNLKNNQIKSIPESIGQLKNLACLYLKYNQIETIPLSIGHIYDLERLYLSHNLISYLPESIGRLQNLEKLWIDDNPISESEINKIKKLLPNCNVIF